MITHVVFFKLKDPSQENLTKTRDILMGMKGRVPQLRRLEVGIDVVRSERSYDIALISEFDTMDDLQAYQVHPVHEGEVVPHMKSVSSAIAAVDYVTEGVK